jgi:ubiquinone/menaquinone biosynthesis C-methylase UbiE
MLRILRRKCKNCKPALLRTDNRGSGVIAIKQDVTSLFGLPDNYFDFGFLNNVSYSLDDPVACLQDVHRVLKPGGEIRLSGPQKKTNLNKLLRQLRHDLEKRGRYDELEAQYQRLSTINRLYLDPNLHRWTVSDVEQQMKDAGFSTILPYSTDHAYGGQSMIVCAKK